MVAALAAGVAALGGCGQVGYVVEQARGQLRILAGRVPIRVALRDPALPAARRRKLAFVLLARRYGRERIGLAATGAYTSIYDTGGRPVAWALSAAPPTALRPYLWRFPIVGAVPYLGFFDPARARRAERRARARGLETYLRPVPAYSTLGWFDDPLYTPLLAWDEADLAEVVLHEMTHGTVFLAGRADFNESFAEFVGRQGAVNLMAELYGPGSVEVARYRAGLRRQARLGRLVTWLQDALRRLFRRKLPRRETLARRAALFAEARRRYRRMFPDPRTRGRFARMRLNNAVVLSLARYNRGVAFHRRVYRALGRRLDRLVALYRRARRYPDPVAWVARRTGVRAGR